VLDRRCLTEAAGRHPLFEGVRRVTVTGLTQEPRVESTEGGEVHARLPGITLVFRHARVSRTRETVTISVGE
jgi:hypothetical protein